MTLRGRGSSGKGCSGWLLMGGAPRRARACRAMATGRRSGYTSAGAGRAIGSRCPTFGWRTCPLLSSVLLSLAGTLCTRGSGGRSVGTPRGARSDSRGRAKLSNLVERRTRLKRLQEAMTSTHSNDSAEEVMRRRREERVLGCFLGAALGDALGAASRRHPYAEIKKRYGPDGVSVLERAFDRRRAITDA